MTISAGHRKTIKHFHEPGDVHELTFSCYRRMPLLTNNTWREMLSVSISRATARHHFRLVSFVYMPEHVHLLVLPTIPEPRIDLLLKAIKRPYSYRIKEQLKAAESPLLKKLTIRQRPGVITFRYWQEGPGYDRNINKVDTILKSIDYIHENPVRRGLCRRSVDWRWSSARYYQDSTLPADPALPRIDGLPGEWLDMDNG